MEYEGKLRDGTKVLFRRIRPDDKERLQQGFLRLSPGSRYRRFFRHLDRLSEQQLEYLTEVDFEDHYAWIASLPDTPNEEGVGVARWIRIPNDPEVAEGAVTVIDDFHNQGIGSTLLWLAGRSAIRKGVKAFRIWVQAENHPMLQILDELDVHPSGWEGGISEIDIPLPARAEELPPPATLLLRAAATGELIAEAREDGRAYVGARLRSAADGFEREDHAAP
jgi:GNAT superfamily N-acetyltransferase